MEPRELFKIIICFFAFLPNLYGQKLEVNSEKGLHEFKFNEMNGNAPFYYKGAKNSEYELNSFHRLDNDLVEDVPIPADILCRNNFGLFVYKVNHKSEIEELFYDGDLDTLVEQKIKSNIRETAGMYNMLGSQASEQFHWFVLPFNSNGGLLDYRSCSNVDLLEIEHKSKFKVFLLTQNLRKLLPEFKSLTIFHTMGHFLEMSKKGMIKHDTM
jgi:hypothetical protein